MGLSDTGSSTNSQETQASKSSFNNQNRAVFDDPNAAALLASQLQGAGNSGLDSQAEQYFRDTLNQGQGVNPYTQQLTDSIRNNFQQNLDNQLASVRSQSVGSPVGRTQIAIGDTIARNVGDLETGIAELLNNQFNTDRARGDSVQQNSAAQLNQGNLAGNQNALSLLGLTKGTDQSGSSKSLSVGTGSSQTQNQGSIMDDISGIMDIAGGAAGALSFI